MHSKTHETRLAALRRGPVAGIRKCPGENGEQFYAADQNAHCVLRLARAQGKCERGRRIGWASPSHRMIFGREDIADDITSRTHVYDWQLYFGSRYQGLT